MSIADQINRLNNAKAAIKESIENKGVSVSDSAKLDEYPALIDKIKVGSGGGGESGGGDSTYVNPDFYEIRTQGGTNYGSLFADAQADQIPDFSTWDTSNVTNMGYMFDGCGTTVKTLDLSSLDTSNVKYMNYMFYQCYSLTSVNLSGWDTSKVTDMGSMFRNCEKLLTLDLSNFNTSKLTYMDYMFNGCSLLTSLDLSNWDTSNVTSMNYVFINCKTLTTVTGELDLSGLKNGFYPGSSSYPTRYCTALETLYLKNIYKNITITNVAKYSINLSDTKVKDECLLYIINELPDLKNDKGLTATSNIVLTLPKTNTLTAEQVQVAIDKGWSVANTTY